MGGHKDCHTQANVLLETNDKTQRNLAVGGLGGFIKECHLRRWQRKDFK